MNSETQKTIIIYGLIVGFVMNFVMMFTFYNAYFNGFKIMVYINSSGEAQLEAFLVVPGTFIFLCIAVFFGWKELVSKHIIEFGKQGSFLIDIYNRK